MMNHWATDTAIFIYILFNLSNRVKTSATTIVERRAKGDKFASLENNRVKECKKCYTIASNSQHDGISCLNYRDISNCTYGYNEYDSSGTPFIISRNVCQGDITRIHVWDIKDKKAYWRRVDHEVSNMIHIRDNYMQFRKEANITWEGLLIRVQMKCKNQASGCLLVKIYGTTNHPLPKGDHFIKQHKIIKMDDFIKRKNKELAKNSENARDPNKNGVLRTTYHVTFLNILYYVMLTVLGIFIIVMLVMLARRKKKKFYNISDSVNRNSSRHSSRRYSESFDLERRSFRNSHSGSLNEQGGNHGNANNQPVYGNFLLVPQRDH